jgi:hypothetical protein
LAVGTITCRKRKGFGMSRAMRGKAVAQPAIPLMKSRRRIAGSLPRYADDGFQRRDYSRDLRSAEWGSDD